MMRYRSMKFSRDDYDKSIYSEIGRWPAHMSPSFNDEYDVCFWEDESIFQCSEYDEKNYGLLMESQGFLPNMYVNFSMQMPSILDNFNSVFTHKRRLLKQDSRMKWAPASGVWIKEPKIYDKTKVVSMISSSKSMCDGHRKRLGYVDKFAGSVDLYGRQINPITRKEDGLAEYMFSIAIENAEYSGYFTEKILDCFATGTVPVYLGDPSIGEVFNTDGIIVLDESFQPSSLNEDLYLSMMDSIVDNFERCQQFLTVEDYIFDNYFRK